MRKWIAFTALAIAAHGAFAGFGAGLHVGVFSPNDALKDNDNGLVVGGDISFKFALFGIKLEAFHVDSSGRYDLPGVELQEVEIDVENMLAADFMYYPAGMIFYFQAGVNYINFDASSLEGLEEEVGEITSDKLGYEVGLGISLFDKLKIQGKYMFTPDVVDKDALDVITSLDDADVTGYMVTVGWHF